MKEISPKKSHQYKKEVLQRLLTKKLCTARAPYFSKAFQEGETQASNRFRQANLIGIGFGAKETCGKFTGNVAVRVYVTKKLPKAKISRQYRIPEMVNGVPTDVIPLAQPKFHNLPVVAGDSIRNANGGAGSLGCILSKGDGKWYILSASHILAPANHATPGDKILQLANGNGGETAIAELTEYYQLKTNGTANPFDAAIARVLKKSDVILSIPEIGALKKEEMTPLLFQSVRKYGASTLHSVGIITDIAVDITFSYGGREYLFDDVIQVIGCGGKFSAGGDSGAIAVDALSNRPIGTIIGGAEDGSYLSPITRILKSFKAKIAD